MKLTQKETTLLQDLKNEEQLCIEKYSRYSQEASDGQLKNLFTQLGQTERSHLQTLNDISNGETPKTGSAKGASQPSASNSFSVSSQNSASLQSSQNDKFLCQDILATEKHASSLYDTCIFEFKDPTIRSALNHIQKEEQEHGEHIYNYMSQNGMYS